VLGAGDYFYATLIDTSNNLEIVKVTARATDTMTIVRAQDGTTARAYNVNDRFELRPTAALFNEKADAADVTAELATKVNKAGDTMTGVIRVARGSEAKRDSVRLHVAGGIGITAGTYDAITWYQGADTSLDTNALGSLRGVYTSGGRAELEWWGRTEIELENATPGSGKPHLRVDQQGRVTMPYQPAFAARFATTKSQNTNSPILFNLVSYNQGGHYNGSTGLFTAPVAGLYAINASALRESGGSTYWELVTAINGSVTNYGTGGYTQTTDLESLTASWVVALGANDTLAVWLRSNSSPVTLYASETFVNGYLIG
jgi:hypothetical protein